MFNQRLLAIGVLISSKTAEESPVEGFIDLEQTLIDAILRFPEDARLASLIFSWIKVHGSHVIVEKFAKLVLNYPEAQYPAIKWAHAIAAFAAQNGIHKWKKLVKRSETPVYLYPQKITESAIALKGSVEWLKEINFIVPENSIRIRTRDILTPKELIRHNRQYRNRYLYGPSWRADIITAIEYGLQSPSEICSLIGCSYEPAHRIFHEYSLAKSA